MPEELRKYPIEAYRMIFRAMREQFGDKWFLSVHRSWYNAWQRQIKHLFFDKDITAAEVISCLEEASGKKRWPMGTGFFKRVDDVLWKNRRERPTNTYENKGPESVSTLLDRVLKHYKPVDKTP